MVELKSPLIFSGRMLPAGAKVGFLTKVQELALVEAGNAIYIRPPEFARPVLEPSAPESPKGGRVTPPAAEVGEVTPPAAEVGEVTPPAAEVGEVMPPAVETGEVTPPDAEVGEVTPPAAETDEVTSPSSETVSPPEATEVPSQSVGAPQKLGRDGRGGK